MKAVFVKRGFLYIYIAAPWSFVLFKLPTSSQISLSTLSVIDNVTLKAATVYGCVFSSSMLLCHLSGSM